MPPDSEIVCPFCKARHPFLGTARQPLAFRRYGDLEVYRCPCGAAGSLSGDIGKAGWRPDQLEEALCRAVLQSERRACHVELNYITCTDPPLLMVWAKRGTRPGHP